MSENLNGLPGTAPGTRPCLEAALLNPLLTAPSVQVGLLQVGLRNSGFFFRVELILGAKGKVVKAYLGMKNPCL